MARMAVRLMTQRLFDVREIFARLEPQRVAAEMGAALHITLDEVITEVAQLHSPDLWALLPVRVKRELVNQAHEEAPPAIAALMRSMQEQIDDLFDIEDMVVRALVRDKPLLNNIFIACGHKELSFIRNSGAYMGGVFGIVQMTVWFFWSNQWMLPAFGFVVGTLTNWLALKAIFQPVQPHYPCGSRGPRVQGLFLQRQQEVAGVYARTIARKVLNSKNILAALIGTLVSPPPPTTRACTRVRHRLSVRRLRPPPAYCRPTRVLCRIGRRARQAIVRRAARVSPLIRTVAPLFPLFFLFLQPVR